MTNICSGFVRAAIYEIVNIRFRRLIASGYTSEEALTLRGWAQSHEMFEVPGPPRAVICVLQQK
jgi:hypothetical protein